MSSKLSFSIPSSKSQSKATRDSSAAVKVDKSQPLVGFDSEARETAAAKVSFTIQSSVSKSRVVEPGLLGEKSDAVEKHYVTEFDSSKTVKDPEKGKPVIAPIPNSWRPVKRMKNLELPITESMNQGGIGFVVESIPAANDGDVDGGMSYGLNLRQTDASAEGREEESVGGEDVETVLLRKLRYDIDCLPDHRGMEEFEDMPVEGFGAAVLRGYGWKEGMGIGKNAKEDVKVKLYEKRGGTFGLGFVPEKLDVSVGKKGRATNKDDTEVHERDDKDRRKHKIDKESRKVKDRRTPWLRRHIRVRIVSRKFEGGKFYLKKGVVMDVVKPYICDISMDDSGELLQDVDQDLLETALPRKGGPVLVLYGEHQRVCGNLVKKDSEQGIGIVEDPYSFERLRVKLDQIAEYVGDPNYG